MVSATVRTPAAIPFAPVPPEAFGRSLVSRFEDQVDRVPQRLALASARSRLSYAELDRAANRLANELLARRGVRHEPVALLLGQGGDAVVATLATLKADKFYVPLEPADPPERLRGFLADARPAALVTNGAHRALAARLAGAGIPVVDVDALSTRDDARPDLSIPPHRLAHVIYTSGSTGEPKGVLQNHRNALHYIRNHTNAYRITAEDRVTLLSSCAFLGAMRDTFMGLLNGASVFPYDVRRDGVEGMAEWLARERITIYVSVATVFRRFAETLGGERFPELRILNVGGEPLRAADVEVYRRLTRPTCWFVNNFGTTETGTFALFTMDHAGTLPDGLVPAGYALEGCEVQLLDDAGQPVAGRGPGEVALTSRYLPLGYWHRPALTRAAYRPVAGRRHVRTYHTGDQGRRLADGCLVVLGRGDRQIKVGGQRVELGEVEAALRQLPDVREAAAIASDVGAGDRRVVAYVVPASAARPTARELRQALAGRLPGPAIPWRFVLLDALPLTSSGKVDRIALPGPGRDRPDLAVALVPPRSPVEVAVAAFWREVLCLDEIGVHDDFLELGGQSLQATQIAARVAQRFAISLSTQSLLESRTVAELSLAITRALVEQEAGSP
jgi:amino acid adenylation domain-containing protein